jgi:hypothetical protein
MNRCLSVMTVIALLLPLPGMAAGNAVLRPAGDKYMYPFIDDSSVSSRRGVAGVFGAYGAIDSIPGWSFDDRDGQYFLDFSTADLAPPGRGARNYRILSLVVTLVVANEQVFPYDPTPDALATYGAGGVDLDPGRPIELYGVGYRGGWTRETFTEEAPFQTVSFGAQNLTSVRNAFALGFAADGSGGDVSNNVEGGFEPNPWAVADSPGFIDLDGNYVAGGLAAGSAVPEGRVFRFRVEATDANIAAYLQDGLNAGRLHLMVSSLFGTSQESTDIPKFYTKDFSDPGISYYLGPRLEAEVVLLPSTTVSRHGSAYRLSFDTVNGQSYQVEYWDGLNSSAWLPLGSPRPGNGETLTHDDAPPAGVSSRFYRVAVSKESQS